MADTIKKEISGDLSIGQIELAIAAFEFGFAQYLSNEISVVNGAKTNNVTFEKLILKKPKTFKLTLRGAEAPGGFRKIRDDVMYISGKVENVSSWRMD